MYNYFSEKKIKKPILTNTTICIHLKNISAFGYLKILETIKSENKTIPENTVKETTINIPPKIKNCTMVVSVGSNKKPGKNAKKNKDTFGFNKFIMNPFL